MPTTETPLPKKLWEPSETFCSESNLAAYRDWLEKKKGLVFGEYHELWEWSINQTEAFWESIWQYFGVRHSGSFQQVTNQHEMPGTKWFEGTFVNYAEHIFEQATDKYPALYYATEEAGAIELSWKSMREKVGAFKKYLQELGVQKGDRVVAYISNCPEAVIGFLATASIGAVWSSCSPDFGTSSVVDRFKQVDPKVLIAVDGYTYNGKRFDKKGVAEQLLEALPTLKKVVLVPNLDPIPNMEGMNKIIRWEEAISQKEELTFERIAFSDPLWVLYSSGTTGAPKAITQSHGGCLLEHLKYLHFHNNCKRGERFFWYTTTGWMMWNYTVASLLSGCTAVLFDGSPAYPNIDRLWELAEQLKINHFGISAGFVVACMKQGLSPKNSYDLSALVSIGSTGSPLPPEGFDWLYAQVKEDLWLTSISGGTDVCSAFVGGCPERAVYSGEIQCRALGCSLFAFDEEGNKLEGAVGEMVVTQPMPSMPIYFWNDQNFERYQESYFGMYPGVWRHGDWISVTERDSVVIYGRSDATLNRGGIRIGTSEIYRAVDKIPQVKDSLVLSLEYDDGSFYMPLFVEMAEGEKLSESLIKEIATTIRQNYTPRHVPDEVVEAPSIPYTISGKKMEAPIKKILMGKAVGKSLNADAMKNPESIQFYKEFAKTKG